MVYISKVYTKFGDQGETMLASGDTVPKDSPRVAAYGEVDELNATIGLVRVELARDPGASSEAGKQFATRVDATLARVQQELFDLGAELAEPRATEGKARLKIYDEDIEALEREIDQLNEKLEPLRSFVLPGGGPVGAAAHLARTVCRRAERRAVALVHRHGQPVRGQAMRYLNRLSDLLFVVARAASHELGHAEVLWDQSRKR